MCMVVHVLAGRRRSALFVGALDFHQRKTEPPLGVLTVPSGGAQGHLQVSFLGNL